MEYPLSELEYWAAFFSIDDNEDKPLLQKVESEISTADSIAKLRMVLD